MASVDSERSTAEIALGLVLAHEERGSGGDGRAEL